MTAPRELRGIGMTIFITHFEAFAELRKKQNIAQYCITKNISNEAGAAIRGGYMEQVLNNKALLEDCLSYIIHHAKRISSEHRKKAMRLLSEMNQQ